LKKLVKFIFLGLFISIQVDSIAQKNEIDSLNQLVKSAKSDSTKIAIYHQLYLVNDDISYAIKNLRFSKKNKNSRGIAISYRDLGRHYYFFAKKDFALSYLNRAMKIAEKSNDKDILMSTYRYIGYIYMMNDPISAKNYYLKSLRIANELDDKIGASYAYSSIGVVYEGMKNIPNNYQIALKYYLKSLTIREKFGDQEEIASSLNETSRIYFWLGDTKKSLELLFKGLEIAKKSKSNENIIYLCNSIGNEYFRQSNFRESLNYNLIAYRYCLKKVDNIELMCDITKMLAKSYLKLGNEKLANEFYNMFISYNDSVINRKNLYDYNLSAIKHELEVKVAKQQMQLKDAELLNQKAEIKRQTMLRNMILVGFVILVFLAFYFYISFRNKRSINLQLRLKNRKIQKFYNELEDQKKIVEANNSKLQKLLLDKELLFREVHHRVKNNLQIISSLLNLQSNTISDQATLIALKQSQSRINTMAILHNKLYQTEDFTNVPIDEYLRQLVSSISDSFDTGKCSVFFEINTDPSIQLNIDIAIPFGLILNELITNSFKYAFTGKSIGKIQVYLFKIENDQYKFTFKDDGIGLPFDYKEKATHSLGLELIEMLVQQLNGTLVIENQGGAFFEMSFDGLSDNN
jgi:two-component sensor histidine kinase